MDLSRLSDKDLLALRQGDMSVLSDDALQEMAGPEPPSGWVKGMRDPFDAGAQMLEKALPESAVSSINQFNNWLIEQGVPLSPIREGGLNQQLREQEQSYQQSRVAEGDTGMDWDRLGGNVLSPANLAIASRIPQPASLAGRVATNAYGGTALGLMQQPAYGEDFVGEKSKQALSGLVGGGLTPLVTSAASRVIAPAVERGVRTMDEMGIPLTVGQRLGGLAKDVEDKLTSVPGVGHQIQNQRLRGYEAYNQSAMNRALEPIGESVPPGLGPRQSVAYVRQKLGAAYDDLLPRMGGRFDDEFAGEVNQISDMIRSLPPKEQKVYSNLLQRELLDRATDAGRMSGESAKKVQESLRVQAEKFGKSTDSYQRDVGDALSEVSNSFDRMLARNNPEYADRLNAINKGYANFKRIQKASTARGTAGAGAEEGLFTPAQLDAAVYALDKTKDKRAFSEGSALMQDLSTVGKEVLPPQVPDSGTAGRFAVANPVVGATSAAMTSPLMPLYSDAVSRLLRVPLSVRPQGAEFISNRVRGSTPFLIPGMGFGANELMYGP